MLLLPSTDPGPEELADWAELWCLFGPTRTVSLTMIADFLSEELAPHDFEGFALGAGLADEDLSEADEAALRGDVRQAASEGLDPLNQLAEATLAQISFRAQVIGDGYPIALDEVGLARTSGWQESPVYPFLCLLGARLTYGLDIPHHLPARLFERVVRDALRQLVGGRAERFGWPPMEDEPPGNFRARVIRLARRMGEEVGLMRNVAPRALDYDLDVIAWRGFDDGQAPGQVVIVCQCAIGQDWAQKLMSIDSWREVINFNSRPIGALVFPAALSRVPDLLYRWHDVTSHDNLPLDRLRLASLLDENAMDPELLDQLRDWIVGATDALPFAG